MDRSDLILENLEELKREVREIREILDQHIKVENQLIMIFAAGFGIAGIIFEGGLM